MEGRADQPDVRTDFEEDERTVGRKLWALLHERSLWIFLAIGVGNTVVSWLIMMALSSWLQNRSTPEQAKWISSGVAFALTSVISFVLNRCFSFHSKGNVWGDLARFALVIAACYFIAFSVATPLAGKLLSLGAFSRFAGRSVQIALTLGQVVFTALNYFGQRFFAFRTR